MAMRVGEMMVIVRAQDFASRTLRRVGGEFAHLSREQQIAAKRMAVGWDLMDAKAAGFAANETKRRMKLAQMARTATKELATNVKQREDLLKKLESMQMRQHGLRQAAMTFGPAGMVDPAAQKRLLDSRRAISGLKEEIVRLDKAAAPLETRLSRLGQVLSRYPQWVRRAATSSVGFAEGTRRMNAELEAAARKLTVAERNSMAFEQALRRMPVARLQEMGHALGGIGRTMQLFGAVGTVALGAAANQAANFNTSMSLAATQARDLTAPVTQVKLRIDQLTNGFAANGKTIDGVMDLMQQFPADQEAMAASAYDVFSSMNLEHQGIMDVAGGLDLLKTANKIAVAGGEDLETATNAMITVFNNFDPQLQHTAETLDTMFDIIRFGRMRLADFNTMMNKVAPAAAGANLSLRDVGGAMAFLTEVMPSQRMVATGISRLIEALNNEDVVKGLDKMGVQVRKAEGGLRPLDDIMVDLAERFPKVAQGTQSVAAMLKEVTQLGRGGGQGIQFTMEGRKALTQILTHLEEYLARQRQIDQNTGEFAKSHEAQMQALGVQWDIFMNRIRAVVIAIGTDAIPVFTEIGNVLSKLLDWWQGLNPAVREGIVRFAVIGAVVTVLAGAFLALLGALMGVEAMFKLLFLRAAGVTTALKGIGMIAGRLAAIGAIMLILEAKRTGDLGAWKMLMGMMSGAAAGFAIGGPIGAIIGGITVPIVMQLVADENLQQDVADKIREASRQQYPEARAWGNYLAQQVENGFKEGMTRSEFSEFWDMSQTRDKVEGNRANLQRKQTAAAQKNLNKSTKDQKNIVDNTAKQWKKYNEAVKEHKQEMEHAKRAQKEWAESLVGATKDAQTQAVDNLRNMYMEIEQLNRTAMGDLFNGPLFSGESWQEAKEWGVTAGIKEMIKDINQATAAFHKWNNGLAQLRKKGLPDEFVKEIAAMGPEEGMGFVTGILKGTPKQQAALIAAWKKRNAAVQSQTKMDFVDEIERFRKAGGDMGAAIIDGFKEAAVAGWFDTWITRTFPGAINAAVNEAVSRWKEQNPRPTLPNAPTPPANKNKPLPKSTKDAGKNAANGSVDNSKHQTVNIEIHDSPSDRDWTKDKERKIAFILKQAGIGSVHQPGSSMYWRGSKVKP